MTLSAAVRPQTLCKSFCRVSDGPALKLTFSIWDF